MLYDIVHHTAVQIAGQTRRAQPNSRLFFGRPCLETCISVSDTLALSKWMVCVSSFRTSLEGTEARRSMRLARRGIAIPLTPALSTLLSSRSLSEALPSSTADYISFPVITNGSSNISKPAHYVFFLDTRGHTRRCQRRPAACHG